VHDRESIWHYNEAVYRITAEGDDGRLDLCVGMNGRNDWQDLE
jgi:hypothetical protein